MNQVLLVDDDALQLQVRELVLRRANFVVAVATTAESALALLRAPPDRFGVVVTDHFLPRLTGVELVRQLRQFLPDIPVIVLSGKCGIESEYEGLNVTVRQKPLPPPELIELVRTRLEESRARHQ